MRIPANPSFAFASGGGGDAIVTDYCLGMYIVTNNDYRDFIAATGARAPAAAGPGKTTWPWDSSQG